MGRNYLKGRDGDCINAVLAAAGYNFGLLLRYALLRRGLRLGGDIGADSGFGCAAAERRG
jgi:hypothetical protein